MTFTHAFKGLNGEETANIVYTVHEEGTIHDVMQEFRNFLLAIGFHPETVKEYIEAD